MQFDAVRAARDTQVHGHSVLHGSQRLAFRAALELKKRKSSSSTASFEAARSWRGAAGGALASEPEHALIACNGENRFNKALTSKNKRVTSIKKMWTAHGRIRPPRSLRERTKRASPDPKHQTPTIQLAYTSNPEASWVKHFGNRPVRESIQNNKESFSPSEAVLIVSWVTMGSTPYRPT